EERGRERLVELLGPGARPVHEGHRLEVERIVDLPQLTPRDLMARRRTGLARDPGRAVAAGVDHQPSAQPLAALAGQLDALVIVMKGDQATGVLEAPGGHATGEGHEPQEASVV